LGTNELFLQEQSFLASAPIWAFRLESRIGRPSRYR